MADQDYNEKMFRAIQNGQPSTVEKLLKRKLCSPNCRKNDDNCTPALIMAVKCKKAQANEDSIKEDKVINVLLENGAKIDERDRLGMTAAMYAARFGLLERLKVLTHHKSDLRLVNDEGYTVVILAALSGKMDCLQFLINELSVHDLNKVDKRGRTALIHTAVHGQLSCMRRLIDMKVALNEVDDNGFSALMHATKRGEFECAKILLNQQKIDINIVSKLGNETALTLALQRSPRDITLIEDLLKRGANIMLSKSVPKYLHEMIARDEKKIVQQMVINGCPPLDRICSENYFQFSHSTNPISPIAVALLSGFLDTARYLIAARFFTEYDLSTICIDPKILQLTKDGHSVISVSELVSDLSTIVKPMMELRNKEGSSKTLNYESTQDLGRLNVMSRVCIQHWHDVPVVGNISLGRCYCRNCFEIGGYTVK